MSTTPGTSPKLTAALTECLRTFARRGRDLRTSAQEQQQSDSGTTAADVCAQTSEDPNNTEKEDRH